MSNQLERGPVRTPHADVLLASVGERGVLCDFYDEGAADTYRDLIQDADGTSEAREFATRTGPVSGPVLELAAGMGRLTFPFLDLGWEVTALELSTSVLAAFRKRLAEAPADVRDRCTLVQGDMSAFALDKRFGTVVISSGSINELDEADRRGLYASVREHLEPGGKFLLSLAMSEAAESEPLERKQELPGRSGRRYVLHVRHLPAEEIQEITIHPADETTDPFVVCTHRRRLLAPDQVVRELVRSGFDVIAQTPFASGGAGRKDMVLVEAVMPGATADAR
ncbi:class I SAM-dependent methyltransferase [Kibdelosporangium aridum]|uniref:Class I SAM-dependent methyltransferase n=2 Tax=Pseudonocardiaceae TaxID=2070 RepID=A0A428ZIW3_KIBAR|nr:daptide-type RiPP biosynthesis methyltransferase [Kibdelosporangium aridum]RSM88005.1 class I SAM-dependent methyltransferase [Kibdelosporangium aridum]CAA11779.1 PCZA361.24 [Amycolatopsis orientalis]